MISKDVTKAKKSILMLGLALLFLLALDRAVIAVPGIILTVDKSSYTVGESPTFTIRGAPPNATILWSAWTYNQSTGQFVQTSEVDADYSLHTDANGNFTVTASAWVPAHVALWKRQVKINGRTAFITYKVTPKLQVNLSLYSVGQSTTYTLTGAAPNSTILWTSWIDGALTSEVDADYGLHTDANGNFTVTASPWISTNVGLWKKQAKVNTSTGPQIAAVEFTVTSNLKVDKAFYTVPDAATFTLTGAPPNTTILWSSWFEDPITHQLTPTGEVDANYGQVTDGNGNRTLLAGAWAPANVGLWKKQAKVGTQIYTVSFRVNPRPLTDFTRKVGNYYYETPTGYSASEAAADLGAAKIAEIGGRNMRLLFNAPLPYHSLTELAQTLSLQKAFSNPNINTYVLTVYDSTTGLVTVHDSTAGQDLNKNKIFLSSNFFTKTTPCQGPGGQAPLNCPIGMTLGQANTAAVENEYRNFTSYLYQTYQGTGKRFIIANREGDNEAYCDKPVEYGIAPAVRNSCDTVFANPSPGSAYCFGDVYGCVPNPEAALNGMKLWFEARQRGIALGKADAANAGYIGVEVYHSIEFVAVHGLHDNSFKDLLHDVIPSLQPNPSDPNVPGFDFVLWSAYETSSLKSQTESTSVVQSRLLADLDLIYSVIGSRNIAIGEFCYGSCGGSLDSDVTVYTGNLLDTVNNWGGSSYQFKGTSYVFNWQLFGSGANGIYSPNLIRQILGDYYKTRYEQF